MREDDGRAGTGNVATDPAVSLRSGRDSDVNCLTSDGQWAANGGSEATGRVALELACHAVCSRARLGHDHVATAHLASC